MWSGIVLHVYRGIRRITLKHIYKLFPRVSFEMDVYRTCKRVTHVITEKTQWHIHGQYT